MLIHNSFSHFVCIRITYFMSISRISRKGMKLKKMKRKRKKRTHNENIYYLTCVIRNLEHPGPPGDFDFNFISILMLSCAWLRLIYVCLTSTIKKSSSGAKINQKFSFRIHHHKISWCSDVVVVSFRRSMQKQHQKNKKQCRARL